MRTKLSKIAYSIIIIETTLILFGAVVFTDIPLKIASLMFRSRGSPAADIGDSFYYSFNVDGTLEETGSIERSPSPYWWLNSGAYLHIENGVGKTASGELPVLSFWRIAYDRSNPLDTENGYKPQNIFRLLTREKWQDFRQEAYFSVKAVNMSESTSRNPSNGLLLVNRFIDKDNLYYMGLRVDGNAIIKKKINGEYYTLAINRLFEGSYDRKDKPNLLPINSWIGLRTEIINDNDGTVVLRIYVDEPGLASWRIAAAAIDDGKSFGGPAIVSEGLAGIRTDFMDVQFRDYRNMVI